VTEPGEGSSGGVTADWVRRTVSSVQRLAAPGTAHCMNTNLL